MKLVRRISLSTTCELIKPKQKIQSIQTGNFKDKEIRIRSDEEDERKLVCSCQKLGATRIKQNIHYNLKTRNHLPNIGNILVKIITKEEKSPPLAEQTVTDRSPQISRSGSNMQKIPLKHKIRGDSVKLIPQIDWRSLPSSIPNLKTCG